MSRRDGEESSGRSKEDAITRASLSCTSGRPLSTESVILAGEVTADTRLYDALKGRVPELYAAGDCTGLGLIRKATEDGARAAVAL